MKTMAMIAACMSMATPAWATDVHIQGIGGHTCGEWIANMAKPEIAEQQRQWVMGFVAGMAWAKQLDFLRGVTVEAVGNEVDAKCAADPPLVPIVMVAIQIAERLQHPK